MGGEHGSVVQVTVQDGVVRIVEELLLSARACSIRRWGIGALRGRF